MKWLYLTCMAFLISCASVKKMKWPENRSALTGNEFYHQAFAMKWKARDSFALKELLAGNIPAFLQRFVPVKVSSFDSSSGRQIEATFFAAPDYLAIGNDNDWARIPLTPMAAQAIADSLHCFLPTRKMVNDIYQAARVKLEPVPMYAFRDSTITMWHHHLIIEGQREGRKGLIAGIKKDLVISEKIKKDGKPDREAIYGWHKPDGKPIQPLYTGHINWWVDYSHGIRLIYEQIRIGRTWMHYTEVLKDPVLRKLLCDEQDCDYYRYPY